MKMSKEHIEKLKSLVGPKTFLEELAEDGNLREYISEFLEDRWNDDPDFRYEMFSLLLKYAKESVPEIDFYYLEHLNESLSIFSESYQKCLTQEL